MAKKSKQPAFEDAFQRLEEIVNDLEAGKLSLEKNLELFEEGIELTNLCREQLITAEERIKVLLKDAGGNFSLGKLDE